MNKIIIISDIFLMFGFIFSIIYIVFVRCKYEMSWKKLLKIPLVLFLSIIVLNGYHSYVLEWEPIVASNEVVGLWKNGDESLLLKKDGFFEYHGANDSLRFSVEEKEKFKWYISKEGGSAVYLTGRYGMEDYQRQIGDYQSKFGMPKIVQSNGEYRW